MMSNEMPLCFAGVGSVPHRSSSTVCAIVAYDVHTFLPVDHEVIVEHGGEPGEVGRPALTARPACRCRSCLPRISLGASSRCLAFPNSRRLGATIG